MTEYIKLFLLLFGILLLLGGIALYIGLYWLNITMLTHTQNTGLEKLKNKKQALIIFVTGLLMLIIYYVLSL